ncbi:MAG: hypothetical protein WD716_04295 [Fimbriimonadaceae bacterium]
MPHKRIILGLFLVIVPPVAALVLASLSVSVDRHALKADGPAPAIWDVLFPIAFISCFFLVPIGIYVIFRALADGRGRS